MHSERNRKSTTLNGTLARTEGEKRKGPRHNAHSDGPRYPADIITAGTESRLILQNRARAQTHTHKPTQSGGTVALCRMLTQ